ncbi:MAG: DUF507 family protein [Bdellovibrionaceae bacterium]|jgi:uncharacterized protein|nr:DUF507 family protein [Pseudobdellovibrionaceae bacterium]
MISEDRASHLTHLVIDGIWNDDLVEYKDEEKAVGIAKRGMNKCLKEFSEVDRAAKATVQSLKRGVLEGTREWDILYNKYYEQEMQKKGIS